MCGIAGVWFLGARDAESLSAEAHRMAAALQHRGPDAEGVWVDAAAGLAFAHRRLSIIDLTETGSQPMHSHCGRYVITYNGECYNFPEIRKLLQAEGCVFRGSSDTEVILEAFARWGLARLLHRMNGMFAFALWDRRKQELVLARDRLGVKPLYYGWIGSTFWFGSELKALRALQSVEAQMDLQSLGLFFHHGYIPAPHSIWAGIHKLPPAHFVVLCGVHERPKPQCYWLIVSQFANGEIPAFDGNEEEAQAELMRLLRRSVGAQMVSDVPVGAFLSGGIDSSTVVALMQNQATRPIRTFTIGFEESKFNEAAFAARIANHLGTQHSEMILSAKEAQDIVPDVGEIFDEPFADASQIPMFAVSRLARKDVTVTISGDGGDELFAGYHHYTTGADRLGKIDRLPRLVQRCAAAGLSALSEPVWDRIVNSLELVPPMRKTNLSGYKIRKYGVLCAEAEVLERYKILNSRWFAPRQIVRGWQPYRTSNRNGRAPTAVSLYNRMAGFDLIQYLPEDILTKVDRAGMAVSLESRVPLLDQDVVAFALSLPLSFKRCDAGGKLLLRRVLKQFVPPALFERPKKGFSVPVSDWIRGPLRSWAEDMLSSLRRNYGTILDCSAIDRKWTQHLSETRDWGELLWPLLMFQTWAQNQNTAVSVATQ